MPTASTSSSSAAAAAAAAPLIGGHVAPRQALKALRALAAHVAIKYERRAAKESELPLDGGAAADDVVWMQLTVKRLSATKKVKPVRIPVPHVPHVPDPAVLLLVADPQRAVKDLLVEQRIKSVTRVVGVEKLRGKFAPFEARRGLMNEHDLVLADDRIVRMLPKLLGKKWLESKKQPFPVDIRHTKNDRLRKEIDGALRSTHYMANKGSCASIRLGTLSTLTPDQLLENFAAALPAVVSKVPGGWTNVQGVEIKTGRSIALPVWNCSLAQLWDGAEEPGMEATFGEEESDEEIVEIEEEEGKKAKTAGADATKGKARSSKAAAAAKPSKPSAEESVQKAAAKKAKGAKAAAPAAAADEDDAAPPAKAKASKAKAAPKGKATSGAAAKKIGKLAKLQAGSA